MNKSSAPIGSVVEEEKSQSSLFEDLLLNDNLQSEPKLNNQDNNNKSSNQTRNKLTIID